MDEHELIKLIKNAPSRERATTLVKKFLSVKGWFILNINDNFDILAIDKNGMRLIIKFWIQVNTREVPKFYLEKFVKGIQKFVSMHDIKNFEAYFISNQDLNDDAFIYHVKTGRLFVKLIIHDSEKEEKPLLEFIEKKTINKFRI